LEPVYKERIAVGEPILLLQLLICQFADAQNRVVRGLTESKLGAGELDADAPQPARLGVPQRDQPVGDVQQRRAEQAELPHREVAQYDAPFESRVGDHLEVERTDCHRACDAVNRDAETRLAQRVNCRVQVAHLHARGDARVAEQLTCVARLFVEAVGRLFVFLQPLLAQAELFGFDIAGVFLVEGAQQSLGVRPHDPAQAGTRDVDHLADLAVGQASARAHELHIGQRGVDARLLPRFDEQRRLRHNRYLQREFVIQSPVHG
jgi:hypothetical protein